MLSPLLSTKLLPPRRGRGNLPRPRLEQLIERIVETTVTVLRAPPGFGKSTLAGAWAEAAQARGGKVAWLNLDETDDNAERLLLYVAAAIQRGLGGNDNLLAEFSLLPAEHLGTLLLNDLERRSEQCFLFIDDYHCVPSAVLVAAFDNLVRFAPDNLHLVFCGRGDLPTSLLAHLYADACLEVDAAQLRFDLDETRDLMLRAGDSTLDTAELIELHSATAGWIAALRASLLALRQRPSGGTRMANSISGLMDELLERLPAELAEQLPRLAAIDKFNNTLAEALTGAANGAALIDELERRQLFLITLDERAQWFSFHPLFREHLRRRLPGAELQATLARTAHWYAGQQLWMDAVRTALACGDTDSAQGWIAHCAMEMVERGDFVILLDWQRQLHDRLLESPVQLKLALGWAAGLAMHCEQARQLLAEVRQALPGIAESEPLEWECRALEATVLALEDRGEDGGELASACFPHLKDRPWISNTLLNVLCFSHLRGCRWQEFYTLPAMARTPLEPSRYQFNQVYRLCLMGYSEALQGRFSQATAILEEALRMTTPLHSDSGVRRHPVLRALPSGFLASIRYLQGNLGEAERLSMESIETVKITGFLDCAGVLLVTTSRLSSGHASPQGARYFLEEGDRLAHTRAWPRLQAQLLLERTRVSLLEHKPHEAAACANQLEALTGDHGPADPGRISEYACLASLAALWCEACGLSRSADVERAEDLRQQARQLNLRLMQLRLGTSLALVHWRRRASDKALDYLLEVAELLEHCNAPQLLLDLPPQEGLQQLIAYAIRQPGPSQALKSRLQRLLLAESDGTNGQNAARLMITLTSKERSVLELVAQGKSNKEMAKLLGVTPETIKSHMKHIFSKLEVDSRAQAAVAAKACGLI
ncbi:LuxR C-terminal-related transcriptional regulator [Pseudomonas citronellolis]|uniref:LuxR C-terminal-related transcriptional regulator n=1 Tax=Pseudomonas citronellolis TaxID=53408 RepID=UPI0023E393C9|nr:LuxR C-terminal-related transcriptional regulator [Pseudomonas citronellolis]MDF3936445.1 LuxR C-terminal-related transcriptional regulator [Pseudomonas citronellolis]